MLRGWVKDKKAALSASGSTHSLNSAAELQNCLFPVLSKWQLLTVEIVEEAMKGNGSGSHFAPNDHDI